MTDKPNEPEVKRYACKVPERIWIIPDSVDEWYCESDMYRGSIEYILKSEADKEKAASYVEGYNKAEKDNE